MVIIAFISLDDRLKSVNPTFKNVKSLRYLFSAVCAVCSIGPIVPVNWVVVDSIVVPAIRWLIALLITVSVIVAPVTSCIGICIPIAFGTSFYLDGAFVG